MMAASPKVSGLGDNFYVNGYDLSGDIASLDTVSGPWNLLEATGIKQSAHQRIFGQRDGTLSFTSLFENIGSVSTPAVPLSTNPVQNTNAWPVLVTIIGGTITNVLVNGSSVGTTAGTYAVPASGTISITYSAAPTWNWFALGTLHNYGAGLVRTDQACMYSRGTAIGNPAAALMGKQLNYDPTRGNDGSLMLKVDLQANATGLEWGYMLTGGIRSDTAATNGASYDRGAGFTTPGVPASGATVTNTSPIPASVVLSGFTATAVLVNGIQVGTGNGTYIVLPGQTISVTYSVVGTWTWTLQTTFGAQAYLELFDLVGTNVDVAVQHSVDNSVWNTIAALDFGSQTTAPQGLRAATANNLTINRYLRAITTGTFSFVQFAVMVNANQVTTSF